MKESLPGFLWIIILIQGALVLVGTVTGNILTIQFHLVRRRDDPRAFSIWLGLWLASSAFEVAAGVAGVTNHTLALPFHS
jgi:hypothetical protein